MLDKTLNKSRQPECATVPEGRKLMSSNKSVDTSAASLAHGSGTFIGQGDRVLRAYHADYQLMPFPKLRREIAVGLRLVEHKHIIHVLQAYHICVNRSGCHDPAPGDPGTESQRRRAPVVCGVHRGLDTGRPDLPLRFGAGGWLRVQRLVVDLRQRRARTLT